MPILLGIDTGGTFTDSVLLDEDNGILATAKSPSILVNKGVEMEKLGSIRVKPRPRSITDIIVRTAGRLKTIIENIRNK